MKIHKVWLAIGILVSTIVLTTIFAARSAQATGPWYVAPGGSDANTCLSALQPCATIDGALGKVSPGDTVLVAAGTYTGTDANVVTLDISATLSGGWNSTFTNQDGLSVIDGENTRRGLTVISSVSANIDHFSIQNGYSEPVAYSDGGGGILNDGRLTVIHSQIVSNTFRYSSSYYQGGGGIKNNEWGILELIGSSVHGNRLIDGWYGDGILNLGILTVTNSTIADNANSLYSDGIYAYMGTVLLNNSTVSHEAISTLGANVYLRNSIVQSLNCPYGTEPGKLISLGYNLIETTNNCPLTTTDLINVDPGLYYLIGQPAYSPLGPTSQAIDHGNPAGCTDDSGAPLLTDQRGAARPLDGNQYGAAVCDIGAYEFDPANPEVSVSLLPNILRSYCTPTSTLYLDDFSNPASGWPITDTGTVREEYLDGAYRIWISDTYRNIIARPGVRFSDFILTVDVKQAPSYTGSYGVIFGQSEDGKEFYTFVVSPGYFGVYRYGSNIWTELAWAQTGAIPYFSKFKLKLVRIGAQISVYANGQLLTTLTDGTYLGSRYVGLIASTYDQLIPIPLDVHFDNFGVYYPSGVCLPIARAFPPATLPVMRDGAAPHGQLDDMISMRR